MAVIVACSSPEISTFVGSVSPGSSTNGSPPASAAALAASRPLTPRPRFLSSRLTMVEEGIQMAFFFMRLRNFAISHSVNLIQGIQLLPLTAVSGGGLRASRAFDVLIPASEECAFVPGCPGGRGALLGVNGLLLVFSFSGLGGLGVRERGRGVVGFSVRTGGSSTGGETRGEVQSLMVSMGALGSGGGRTSPGTMTFLPRSLLAALSVRSRLFVLSATLISSGRTPSLLSRLRLGMALAGKKLMTDANNVVTEFIEGMVETYPNLQYLDGFPEVKVVLRADVSRGTYDKVAIISGGGSGHEPAHAGFVGAGMLTAAVCGDVFTSPPANSILAGIRAVTGPQGCLLIVKNYTGDRLNFGLAAEQAKSEGYKVETVIVGDDCALPPPRGVSGRRGLAGTILIEKVAGAAAATGLCLADVAAEASRAAQMVGTMGVALSVCTIPGQVTSDRLGPGKMELGLGIHGEPGAAVADLQPVDIVVSHVLKQILSLETQYVPIKRGSRVALMVNGLGATPLMELMIAAGKAVAQLQLDHGLAVERVYTGSFMTSLDMAGFSISVMKVDQAILARLDAPTKAPSWPIGVDGPRPPTTIPVPMPPTSVKVNVVPVRPQELTVQGKVLEVAIKAGAEEIIKLKDALNEWDSKVGDGDCGTTMCKGATAILEDMKNFYPLNDAAATVNEIGISVRKAMGGTSGVLYNIFCKAAYAKLKDNFTSSNISANLWASVLDAAVVAVSKYGGAMAGYRTMLDALIPASASLQERLAAGDDPLTAFIISAEAATTGAESTKNMQAQAGRSAYIPADILGSVPDPGAKAAAAWFRAAAFAVADYHQKVL